MNWLDGFDVIEGHGSGSWAGKVDAPKIVWHSTQGPTLDGAVSAFRQHDSWPHFTVDPRVRRKVQHVPLDVASRSLRNTSAPGQTNRDGRTYQIEVVGFAEHMADLTERELAWLAYEVVVPLTKATGTPLRARVDVFHQYPPENGHRLGKEPWRLISDQFDAYSGHLSHAEVPENLHGDPGPLAIAKILAVARQALGGAPGQPVHPTPGGPLMALTDDEQHELLTMTREIHAALGCDDPKGAYPKRIRDGVAHIDKRTEEIVRDTRDLTGKPPAA